MLIQKTLHLSSGNRTRLSFDTAKLKNIFYTNIISIEFLIFFKKHPQARSSVIDRTFLAHGANSNSTLYMAIPKQSDAKIERFSVHCSEMPYLLTSFRISS
jgi:hypothetical protein